MRGPKRLATLIAFGLIFGSITLVTAKPSHAVTFYRGFDTSLPLGAIMRASQSAAPTAQSVTFSSGQTFFTFARGQLVSASRSEAAQSRWASINSFFDQQFLNQAFGPRLQQTPVSGVFNNNAPPAFSHAGGSSPTGNTEDIASSDEGNNSYATPIPPTIWLLASALAGLLGFASRRSQVA